MNTPTNPATRSSMALKQAFMAAARSVCRPNTLLNRRSKHWRSFAAAVLIVSGLMAPTTTALAQSHVIQPNASPYGLTYGQWSARHWQWTYWIPKDQHPLTDTADCSAGQSGSVWFLGGTFTATPTGPDTVIGTASRRCTVPAGKALFFPIVDTECSAAEGNGTTDADLRFCAKFYADHVTDLQATVDGIPIQNLQKYRAQSPLFSFGPLLKNSLLDYIAPAGTISPSVADGYYLMLAPPSPGRHTIYFHGAQVFTKAADGFDFTFTLDITYQLTVQ